MSGGSIEGLFREAERNLAIRIHDSRPQESGYYQIWDGNLERYPFSGSSRANAPDEGFDTLGQMRLKSCET